MAARSARRHRSGRVHRQYWRAIILTMAATMVMEIRDAIAQDLPRIIEIERLAFPTPWSLKSFERELTLPFSRITIASISNPESEARSPVMAGFLCRWLVADECHILN